MTEIINLCTNNVETNDTEKWFCYILKRVDCNDSKSTYSGSTNDLSRRIRQHNGELVGGAKATKGKQWEFYAILTGFVNHQNCLSAEWRIKHPTNARKRPAKYCGVKGRIAGLNEVLCQEKWTQQCTINNSDCEYTLYINKDVIDELNQLTIPPNITVVQVDNFDKKFIQSINNTKK